MTMIVIWMLILTVELQRTSENEELYHRAVGISFSGNNH